jgi:hypothetical protein
MAVISIKNKTKSGSLLVGNAPFIPTDYESIATVLVTGSESSISFTSIPSTYQHLQIRAINQTGQVNYNLGLTFNGDTGSNWSYHQMLGYYDGGAGTAASASTSISNPNIFITGSSGQSSFAPAIVDILDYTNTNKYTTVRAISAQVNSTNGYATFRSAAWMNTNAVTSITIGNSGQTIAAGSHFALYGIKG